MGRKLHARLLGILSLFALSFLGGCKMELFDSQGQVGVKEEHLILLSTALMLIVVVPVIIMACLFAYKYRSTNLKADYQPNWDYSLKIESIVWGVPCLIVLALSIVSWQSTHDLDPAKPLASNVKPITIDVVSLDWKWLFIYPDQHIATVNEIAFPANVPVHFVITSDSVMNSFFIPQLGSQIYAMAGMKEALNLIADRAGTYEGLSGNYSGRGFSGMKFKALATSQADFDKWVDSVKQSQSAGKLDAASYPAVAKPSEDAPVHYYSDVEPGLFDAIVDKYTGMNMDKNMYTKTGMDETGMDMDAPGANDVR
jgi:cytochrome o ubiquinol oxidase subunit 2